MELVRRGQFVPESLPHKDLNFRGNASFTESRKPATLLSLDKFAIQGLNRKAFGRREVPGGGVLRLSQLREESSKMLPVTKLHRRQGAAKAKVPAGRGQIRNRRIGV